MVLFFVRVAVDSARNGERLCDGFNVLSSNEDLKVLWGQCIALRCKGTGPRDQQDADRVEVRDQRWQ